MKKFLYKDLYDQEEKHWWHIAKRKIVLSFAKKYLKTRNNMILDIGCGAGKNLENLKLLGKVWGVDSSYEAIKFCKIRGLKNVKLGKVEKLTFPNNSFNLITLLDVLEHVDDKKALSEVKRVLRKKSYVIITVPAYPSLWSKWDENLRHKRRYKKQGLKKLLESGGFKIINLSFMHSYLLPWHLLIRPIKSLLQANEYSSDFNLDNPFWGLIGKIVTQVERPFVTRGLVPFGLSLIVVAQKNEVNTP
jgi:SAM-dependent methyltransferase